ncbi:MAG: RsiW-degrading membrane proteinase PrsW (M82 family) [Salibacteraceae bacterium]
MIFGAITMAFVTAFAHIKYRKHKSVYSSKILIANAIYGVIILFLLGVPNRTWHNLKYPNNPEFVDALINSLNDLENELLRAVKDTEREKMNRENREEEHK